jgi:hypothetical protein
MDADSIGRGDIWYCHVGGGPAIPLGVGKIRYTHQAMSNGEALP